MSFVFMSVPLFNLIVVNERALLGVSFNYYADRYMENIIKNGAHRCYVFQSTVLITGLLLLLFGPLGIEALWMNWVILAKTILLFILMGMLFYVHFKLQPKIESLLSDFNPEGGSDGSGGFSKGGTLPYYASDFLYSRYYKRIPLNKIITVRRFPFPTYDNLDFVSSQPNEHRFKPISQAVTSLFSSCVSPSTP